MPISRLVFDLDDTNVCRLVKNTLNPTFKMAYYRATLPAQSRMVEQMDDVAERRFIDKIGDVEGMYQILVHLNKADAMAKNEEWKKEKGEKYEAFVRGLSPNKKAKIEGILAGGGRMPNAGLVYKHGITSIR